MNEVAEYYALALAKGYDNTVSYRQAGKLSESQVVDLHFQDFGKDPVGSVASSLRALRVRAIRRSRERDSHAAR